MNYQPRETFVKDGINYEVIWRPNPGPQTWLITCPVFETLFGGARGGGKSDGVLGEFASHADIYGINAIGLCVRRERTQLVELIERSRVLYKPLGANFHEQDKMWTFPNGARLRFAYLENDKDADSYQGHSYTRVYVEEMGTFPNPAPIFKLFATLRSGAGVPCRFIATANPGGPGHLWIKQRYIDHAPLGMKIIKGEFKHPYTGEMISKERIFIPSKISDNPYTNTPEYIGSLYLSGNAELVKAWLLGDWNVTLGAFFQEWNTSLHVIKEFKVPKHWTRFTSFDMGSSSPFSVGWWTIVPDEFDTHLDQKFLSLNSQRIILPKGSLIRYKEWYGSPDHSNKGLKYTAEEIAQGITIRELDEPRNERGRARISYRVADPKIFAEEGGPSIAERMGAYPNYIIHQKADNKRAGRNGAMGGWDQLRARLKGDGVRPMIYFMDNCIDAIRTLPALQHDPDNLEDVDTKGEDHAPDEIRYACMSRPYSRTHTNDVLRAMLKANDNEIIINDDLDSITEPSRFNIQRIR